MAVGFWRTGPAIVYTYTGANAASQTLGIANNGVDIELTKNYREIMTDVFGDQTPAELQDMGMVATITCPLIGVDPAVLNTVLAKGNAGSQGQLNTPGRLVGANDAFAVGIAAADDTPWKFSYCVVRPAFRIPMSVVAKPLTITFFSWPYAPANTTSGINTTLFTRSL